MHMSQGGLFHGGPRARGGAAGGSHLALDYSLLRFPAGWFVPHHSTAASFKLLSQEPSLRNTLASLVYSSGNSAPILMNAKGDAAVALSRS